MLYHVLLTRHDQGGAAYEVGDFHSESAEPSHAHNIVGILLLGGHMRDDDLCTNNKVLNVGWQSTVASETWEDLAANYMADMDSYMPSPVLGLQGLFLEGVAAKIMVSAVRDRSFYKLPPPTRFNSDDVAEEIQPSSTRCAFACPWASRLGYGGVHGLPWILA